MIKLTEKQDLLKRINKIGLKNLPMLFELVPTYGSILSKIFKSIIDEMCAESENKKEKNISEQIEILQKAVQDKVLSEVEIINKVRFKLLEELKSDSNVYMFGIIISPFECFKIDSEIKEELSKIFKNEYEYGGKYAQSNECVTDFFIKYVDSNLDPEQSWDISVEDFYEITEDNVVIYFRCDDCQLYKRDDDKLINFVHSLNCLLDKTLFGYFSIF